MTIATILAIPTLTTNPHASNYAPSHSATPFAFPGGRRGIGCGAANIIFVDLCDQIDADRLAAE